ncbi:uncharacterized protein UV8b_06942 [Ustilaginoidea virens]|uniref:t-SNARE affecting a late Golgi compartment protein 1 n=1 Tax=Ustilaginoidea virens TaxID=1159556 RepID=A0A8E5MKB5_USTVR|nr:uncharacterized protein UV8b_06942 [Ustilaginoidea virens]QUC22701.1 hypothetical protein UV8b_06942 [Ustilaginoidea virens]
MMSSTSDEDPFLQVQQDVLAQLASTRPLFASFLRIRSLAASPSSPELASARADLEAALAALADDLADLAASVHAVESTPAHYGVSAAELSRRKQLVHEVGGQDDDGQDDPDALAELQQQQQMDMMREQDEHLDGVFQTVGHLRRQAGDMGRELEEQADMLDVVDETVERVGGRLQVGMQKLGHVVRQNEDRWSSCCIGVLILVLIVLLVLLLIV